MYASATEPATDPTASHAAREAVAAALIVCSARPPCAAGNEGSAATPRRRAPIAWPTYKVVGEQLARLGLSHPATPSDQPTHGAGEGDGGVHTATAGGGSTGRNDSEAARPLASCVTLVVSSPASVHAPTYVTQMGAKAASVPYEYVIGALPAATPAAKQPASEAVAAVLCTYAPGIVPGLPVSVP